jgi:hypothetical protein
MGVGEMDKASFTRFLVGTLMPAAARCQDGAIAFVCMDWRHMTEATARRLRGSKESRDWRSLRRQCDFTG